MLTDELRRHGWREMPTAEQRAKWEAMGGRWSIAWDDGSVTTTHPQMRVPNDGEFSARFRACCAWRPVHPDHGWSFAWWMWAEVTGESLVPTEPGWNLWTPPVGRGEVTPVHIWRVSGFGLVASEPFTFGHHRRPCDIGGTWHGPVLGMPPSKGDL